MQLDQNLNKWLGDLANEWKMSQDDIALVLAESEIENRVTEYPRVRQALVRKPFDLQMFASAARECWILHYSFDAMRFNKFIESGEESSGLIQTLVNSFPPDDDKAAERIDSFVEDAILLGYSNPSGGFDHAGACQLASLILTSVMPDRFVDYRRNRWVKLAALLDYPEPEKGSGNGKWIVWAGKFASDITETKTFKKYWPSTQPSFSEPLWVISGMSWGGVEDSERPESDPIDPEQQSFPEGAIKRRLHFARERSRAVVAQAKALAIKNDPYLHCEACGFSFVENYGPLGAGFIEAHHTIPVSDLKKGSTTRVDDLSMLCANCHRMIHRGEKTLSIKELKLQIETVKSKHSAQA